MKESRKHLWIEIVFILENNRLRWKNFCKDTFLWLVTFVSAENEIIDNWFKIKGIF